MLNIAQWNRRDCYEEELLKPIKNPTNKVQH